MQPWSATLPHVEAVLRQGKAHLWHSSRGLGMVRFARSRGFVKHLGTPAPQMLVRTTLAATQHFAIPTPRILTRKHTSFEAKGLTSTYASREDGGRRCISGSEWALLQWGSVANSVARTPISFSESPRGFPAYLLHIRFASMHSW